MALSKRAVAVAVLFLVAIVTLKADDKPFRDAPASAKAMKNPYEGQAEAATAGKALYARNCLACHGKALQGTGNIPSLVDGKLHGITSGEIFWFITKGSTDNGMPAWGFLPEQQRWQIVSYLKSLQ
jgi:mono/diheme cytochrome c family protein